MTLLLTMIILWFIFSLFFLGISILLQGWLYNAPADRLPIRAIGAGALVALFFTYWCWIDGKNPGKYGTLLDFSQYETAETGAIEAIRKVGDQEQTIPLVKRAGGKNSSDYLDPQGNPFKRSDADGIIIAVQVKEKDQEKPTRFNANLKVTKREGQPDQYQFPDEYKFIEEGGKRYIAGDNLAQIVHVRKGLLVWNLLLNFAHLVIWVVAIWFGMRFAFGHAFGIAFGFWLFMMLIVLPVLFQKTRPKPVPVTPEPKISWVVPDRG